MASPVTGSALADPAAVRRPSFQTTRARTALPFELLEPRLRPARVSDRSVARTRLIERLNRPDGPPIVVLSAGPGYGKTTALAQWAASGAQRPCAWVSVDHDDNDPVVLLTYVAVALDRVSAIGPGVFEALASPDASIEAKIVPRLGAALAAIAEPIALVLDDVHTIENPQCIDALVALAGHLSRGSQLVLSTRDRSALPLGLLRARALSLELGPDDLRMEEQEARELVGATAADISDADVAELVRHTEGWPAGLYLAALSVGTSGRDPGDVRGLTGNDPFFVDFLRSEFLARLPEATCASSHGRASSSNSAGRCATR